MFTSQETSRLICRANQLTGFYMMGTLVVKRLTFSTPYNSESCIKIKINLNFYFHAFLWCLKRFNVFIKPFDALKGSVKVKIQVNFLFSCGNQTGRVEKASKKRFSLKGCVYMNAEKHQHHHLQQQTMRHTNI